LRKSALRTDPYLAERYLVSYLPSASSLLLPTKAASRPTDLVALGCAGHTPWDVEYELRDIRSFFKDVRLYFGKEATLETLRREKGDVLHLAVEMQRDEDQPGNTHIVLSDGKSSATFDRVSLGRLLTIPAFGAVVVSNLGEEHTTVHPAEPYVLLAAGSSVVIMNSYVPTRGAKKVFGAGMYTALLSGVAVDAAYRKAQLEMIKDPAYAAPHFWAPFFLWSK
jgi:CHAT domain-containing protein